MTALTSESGTLVVVIYKTIGHYMSMTCRSLYTVHREHLNGRKTLEFLGASIMYYNVCISLYGMAS
ncbi:hypothetical protein ACF0H5_006389 [Mactra antiquata]